MSISKTASVGAIATVSAAAVLFFVNTGSNSAKPEADIRAAVADTPDHHIASSMAHAMHRDLGIAPQQIPGLIRTQTRAATTEELAKRHFGHDYAGTWIEKGADGNYHTIVATTRSTAPARFSDAEVRPVNFTMAELDAAVDRLNRIPLNTAHKRSAVQSWAVDLVNNAVSITVLKGHEDEAVNFAALSGVDSRAIRIETTDGIAMPTAMDVDGGLRYDMPSGTGYYVCSIGFSVTKGTTKGFVTAGHCPKGPYGSNPVGKPVEVYGTSHDRGDLRENIGSFQGMNYPGTDMAWASVGSSNTLYADVYNYKDGSWIDVKGSNEGVVGTAVCRYGFASGWSCGTITKINVSANYGGSNTVTGLRQSNACTTQGDSGGSWVTADGHGQGVTSGGSLTSSVTYDNGAITAKTNCEDAQSTRTTWYQPLKPILSKYGLTLATQ